MARDEQNADREDIIRRIEERYPGFFGGAQNIAPRPEVKTPEVSSRAYKEFKREEEEEKREGPYELACNLSARMLRMSVSAKERARLEDDLAFLGLKTTPEGVASFAVLSTVAWMLFWGFMLLFSVAGIIPGFLLPSGIALLMVLAGPAIGALAYSYPSSLAEKTRLQEGGNLVIIILYMIVYLKSVPNLEGAVRFAAEHGTGKVTRDLKLILWRLENGMINNIEEGLEDYMAVWRDHNREFVEAIEFIRSSMQEMNPARRDVLLDRAIDVLLEGTDTRMKRYARSLKLPVMIVHSLGIMLPVLGMIVFPLVAMFMGELVSNIASYLAYGYDILIPGVVFYFVNDIMSKRPATRAQVDPKEIPGGPRPGCYRIGGVDYPVWPLALGVALLFWVFALGLHAAFSGRDVPLLSNSMFHSVLAVWGLALGIAIYSILSSAQKMKYLEEIERIEEELDSALFALGNRLSGGMPIELALVRAASDIKNLEISGLFRKCARNMNLFRMTLEDALFNPKNGAVLEYPSRMIKTIMRSIVESIKRGTAAAASNLFVISSYLRKIKSTQEKIDDLMDETVSSMKFQVYILIPTVSGIVVATAHIIMRLLMVIGEKMNQLKSTAVGVPMDSDMGSMMLIDPTKVVDPSIIQLVVGIYMVFMTVCIGLFYTRIKYGHNPLRERLAIGYSLIVGVALYTLVLTLTSTIFLGMIDVALLFT